jgi:hypothetical protein
MARRWWQLLNHTVEKHGVIESAIRAAGEPGNDARDTIAMFKVQMLGCVTPARIEH